MGLRILCLGLLSVFAPAFTAAGESAIPDQLRCAFLENPLGLDEPQPRLSWILRDSRRGARQEAYQVLVASAPEILSTGKADLWDSGRVVSDRSNGVAYLGKPLVSNQRCFWKVRVWQPDGSVTSWSKPGIWTMGLLDPGDWTGEWIADSRTVERALPAGHPGRELTLDAVSWIWCRQPGRTKESRPQGNAYFRRLLDLPNDIPVRWAYLALAADDRFSLSLNGARISISEPGKCAAAELLEVELTERLHPGTNLLAIKVENLEPGPAGLAGRLVVELADGRRIVSSTGDGTWRAREDNPDPDQMRKPVPADSGWAEPEVIAPVGSGPWGVPTAGYRIGWRQASPSPVFRREFHISEPLQSAVLHIAGIGYHEARINGSKVGDHYLDPAFTRYDRRVLYTTHDVTRLLKIGDNAIGVLLGNGWYNMHTRTTWNFDQAPWRDTPRLLAQLRLEFADGTVETIDTDAAWRASTGPVLNDSIFQGEVYDARREAELEGWDAPGYDDRDWDRPGIVDGPSGKLASQTMPPIRVTETITPVSITHPRPGTYVVDMGRAIAGWAQLFVKGPSGTEITLRYGERLDNAGLVERSDLYRFTFSGPFQTDTYIMKGVGEEIWEPRFVYHGFRYVQVEGFPGKMTASNIRGRFAHTDFQETGEFRCSNETVNRIQSMTLASFRANYHGYPTDCPHREKNGWTGDAHLAAEQAMYNWGIGPSYAKWIQDIEDEQRDDGSIPGIVPTSGWGYHWGNGPAWDSAFLLIPWYMYLYTGDERILKHHFDRMKLYVDYLSSRSENGIVSLGLGDWVPAKTETPAEVTSTGYYHQDARIAAKAARIAGLDTEAARYSELVNDIKTAFNREYGKAGGDYANGSQTALSCALHHELVPEELHDQTVQRLVEAVEKAGRKLDVGILGSKYLFRVLSQNGHHELAWQIATQMEPPGYGWWLSQGATTLWEQWSGEASRIHVMFGDISAWFYQYLAGIQVDTDSPGFKHAIIQPMPVGDLTWVRARTETPYGTLASYWQLQNDGDLLLEVTIPANTTASVILPNGSLEGVTESGNPLNRAPGVSSLDPDTGTVVIQSGQYRFVIPSR